MSKCWVQCAFLVKVMPIDFWVERYIAFKEKYVSNFSCSLNVTVTSQNDKPSFQMVQRDFIF